MCYPSRFGTLAAIAVLVAFSTPAALFAQNAITEEGLLVAVGNPISSEVVQRIRNQVEPRQNSRPVRTVVFDFTPLGKDVNNTNFAACYELAKVISQLRANANTVAFVHATVTGHTMLPVLACKEVAMSREAKIGQIVPPPDEFERSGYQFMTSDRKSQWAAIRKMFDPNIDLGVGVLKQGGTTWYVDRNNPAEVALIAGTPADVPGAQPGQVALYTADQARKIELAKVVLEKGTQEELAEAYNLSAASLRPDILNGRTPDAYRYTLEGEVDGAMRESMNRILNDLQRKKGNILILTLKCSRGDLKIARDLADDLRKAQTGDDGILIVAFILDAAPGPATFLALGCTDIVMSKRKDSGGDEPREAELGDFHELIKAEGAEALDVHRRSLKELAELRGLPGLLVDGLFEKDLVIHRVKGTNGQRRLMTDVELEAEKAAGRNWANEGTIKAKGQLLRLNATRAEELGVARFTTETTDPAAVYAYYGLETSRIKDVTPGMLDRFAEFLRMPVVTVLLVVIGFTGLILELKVPGLTVPGIIAALCFILVFWAQSRFSGEMFVLALLLFILGLVLIALELFVFPGFGAPGIFGIFCMLAGLGLVTFDKVPQTPTEWGLLGVKVSQYMFGLIGSFGLAFVIARFLPKMPYANRLLLAPPSEHSAALAVALPGAEEAAMLLGAIGTTNTPLRPAGVVRFDDKFVDVVSDGAFIPAGTRVQVIAVEGTRIVVKEV
jgi:membrane-bound ClpP family serine protease